MESYARSAHCRWRILREYFGEEPAERCGVCDNCRKGLAEQAEPTEQAVQAESRDQSAQPEKPEISALSVGDRVSLPRHGEGKVEEVEEGSVVVRFPDGRSRKFKSEFARLVRR